MKKTIIIFITIIIALLSLSVICFAHGGKTDESGGHYDSSTGEYHYHHGYPAHQHPDGICPYEEEYEEYEEEEESSHGIVYKIITVSIIWCLVGGLLVWISEYQESWFYVVAFLPLVIIAIPLAICAFIGSIPFGIIFLIVEGIECLADKSKKKTDKTDETDVTDDTKE